MSNPVLFEGTADADQDRPARFRLSKAVCIYADGAADKLAMVHAAGVDGRLGPGQPIDPIDLAKSIYRLQRGEMLDRLVLVGENVLAENRDAVLWWRPASVEKMWFKTADPVPALTAMNGQPVPQPALVFKAHKRTPELSVWALAENKRPTADTPLYHAPYMNLSPSPHVCLGNMSVKKITVDKNATPAQWEAVFFDSNFSHTPPHLHHATITKTEDEEDDDKCTQYASFLAALKAIPSDCKATIAQTFAAALVRFGDKTLSSIL